MASRKHSLETITSSWRKSAVAGLVATAASLFTPYVAHAQAPAAPGVAPAAPAAPAEAPRIAGLNLDPAGPRLSFNNEALSHSTAIDYFLGTGSSAKHKPDLQYCGIGGRAPLSKSNCDFSGGNRVILPSDDLKGLLTRITGYDFTPVAEIRAQGPTFVTSQPVELRNHADVVLGNFQFNNLEMNTILGTFPEIARAYAQEKRGLKATFDLNCPDSRYDVFYSTSVTSGKTGLLVKVLETKGTSIQNVIQCYTTLGRGSTTDTARNDALIEIANSVSGKKPKAKKVNYAKDGTLYAFTPYVKVLKDDTAFIPEASLNSRGKQLMPVSVIITETEIAGLGAVKVTYNGRELPQAEFDFDQYDGHRFNQGKLVFTPAERDDIIVAVATTGGTSIDMLARGNLTPKQVADFYVNALGKNSAKPAAKPTVALAKRTIEKEYGAGSEITWDAKYGQHALVTQVDKRALGDFLAGKPTNHRWAYLSAVPTIGTLEATTKGSQVTLATGIPLPTTEVVPGMFGFRSTETDDLVYVGELVYTLTTGDATTASGFDYNNTAAVAGKFNDTAFVKALYGANPSTFKPTNPSTAGIHSVNTFEDGKRYVALVVDKDAAEKDYFVSPYWHVFSAKEPPQPSQLNADTGYLSAADPSILKIVRGSGTVSYSTGMALQKGDVLVIDEQRLKECYVPMSAFEGAPYLGGTLSSSDIADYVKKAQEGNTRNWVAVINSPEAVLAAVRKYTTGDLNNCTTTATPEMQSQGYARVVVNPAEFTP